MNFKRTVSLFCCQLITLTTLAGCFGNRPGKPKGPAADETVQPLEAMKFDAAKQNLIFRDILSATQGDCAETPQKSAARLVNATEYIQTVEAVFELDLDDQLIRQALPSETVGILGYDHLRQFNVVSAERLASYVAANSLVAKAIREKKADLLNCGRPAQDCVQSWLTTKLPQLWRQNLDAGAIQAEVNLFQTFGGNSEALGLLAERLLLSPHFLFRRQLAQDGALNSWELAGLLADVLWGLPPSPELTQLAANGGLASGDALRQQIRSMMQDPRFFTGLQRFTGYWLTTGVLDRKNFSAMNSPINDSIKAGMKNEAAAFLYFLVQSNQDQMNSLFSANFTVGDSAYAQTFGFTPAQETVPGLPSGMTRLMYPAERAGLVSQPSLVAISSNLNTTNVPLRGKSIMEKFLCQTLETPPNLASVVANVKFDQTVSVHDAFEKATGAGSCGECHKLVNGIGYGMENVGSDGRMQANDNHGFPVNDPQGRLYFALPAFQGDPATFAGIAGLSRALGTNKEVETCMAVQAFRLVYARLEEADDVCRIANVHKKASRNGLEFDGLLTEMLIKRSGFAE